MKTFERLAKTFQFLKMIHSGYSRSYFNLFLIYTVVYDASKYNLHTYKNSCDSSKKDLIQKYRVNFPHFQIKTFHWSFFITLKLKLNFAQIAHASSIGPCIHGMSKWLLLCFSRNKSFPEILSSGEYKKCWFLKPRDSVNSIRSRLKYCSSFVSSHNAPSFLTYLQEDRRASARRV